MKDKLALLLLGVAGLYIIYKDTQSTISNNSSGGLLGSFAPSSNLAARQLLASAIAQAEGYNTPGTIPNVRNNPGDLEDNGVIVQYASPTAGFDALDNQLKLIEDGLSSEFTMQMTFSTLADIWTGYDQANSWANNVVSYIQNNGGPVTLSTSNTLQDYYNMMQG